VRGESMTCTVNALLEAGYEWEANALAKVATDKQQWEQYARDTFMAHSTLYLAGQFRYLQYVNPRNIDWWKARADRGAVLLGKLALEQV
jgi:hypothetical protein